MDAVGERAERLTRWSAGTSFGYRAAHELGIDSPQALSIIRVADSLYPPAGAGQTVLGSEIDPARSDALISAALRIAGSETSPSHSEPAFPLWYGIDCPLQERLDISAGGSWAGKPRGALYTSEGEGDFPGAWPLYALATGTDVSDWSAWRLTPAHHRRLIIDSAAEWCAFASRWSSSTGAIDWVAVGDHLDAVHVTLAAVAAIDCFEFSWQGRLLPAPYWGTETTVWLRWVFTDAVARGRFLP